LQAELDPTLPSRGSAYIKQLLHIFVVMLLEILAHVKPRLGEAAAVFQHDGQQETPDAPVSIAKRVDGLELVMDQEAIDQRIVGTVPDIEVLLQGVETLHQQLRRRRNEAVVGAGGDLNTPEFSRRSIPAADAGEQRCVEFPK